MDFLNSVDLRAVNCTGIFPLLALDIDILRCYMSIRKKLSLPIKFTQLHLQRKQEMSMGNVSDVCEGSLNSLHEIETFIEKEDFKSLKAVNNSKYFQILIAYYQTIQNQGVIKFHDTSTFSRKFFLTRRAFYIFSLSHVHNNVIST